MADSAAEPEPSMEQILEMIRRNITEDGRARAARIFGTRGGNRDILDLTEAIADDGSVRHIDPAPLAERAAPAVAAAPPDRPVRSDAGARTLEDLAADLLRPLLKEWLDEHLPALVERLAREQLGRRSGDA